MIIYDLIALIATLRNKRSIAEMIMIPPNKVAYSGKVGYGAKVHLIPGRFSATAVAKTDYLGEHDITYDVKVVWVDEKYIIVAYQERGGPQFGVTRFDHRV